MPKQFFTERDIEDLSRQGGKSLVLSDDIVLTELAYEKAERLGVKLIREHESRPNAPVRPYIAASPGTRQPQQTQIESSRNDEALRQRIHQAVIARLGNQVDSALLDTIITRVLKSTGIR